MSWQQPMKICLLLKTTSRTCVSAHTQTFPFTSSAARRKTSHHRSPVHTATHTYILHQRFSRTSLVYHSHSRCLRQFSNLINQFFLLPSPVLSPFSSSPALLSSPSPSLHPFPVLPERHALHTSDRLRQSCVATSRRPCWQETVPSVQLVAAGRRNRRSKSRYVWSRASR